MRLRLKFARPCARGSRRLVKRPPGPPSTVTRVTYSSSVFMSWLFSALATALRSSFSIGSAANTPANCSSTSASFTLLPRIASATRRNLRGPMRANFRCATASVRTCVSAMLLHRCLIAAVAAEVAGGRELAELVTDHVFGNEHRNVRFAVVHADRVSDHRRDDRRGAAPRLDDALFAALVHRFDFLNQMVRDE